MNQELLAAFKIVTDLAEQNVIDEQENWDEHNRQMLALRLVDDFIRGLPSQ